MKAIFGATLAVLLMFALAATTAAATPTKLSGSFTSTVTITSIRQEGGNLFVAGREVQTLTGGLNGTRVAEGTQVIHPDSTFDAHDTGVFTGFIGKNQGSVVIDGTSHGVGNEGSGQFVVGFGTGGLAGLHGVGSFVPVITGATTVIGTYEVDVQFPVAGS